MQCYERIETVTLENWFKLMIWLNLKVLEKPFFKQFLNTTFN